MLWSLIWKKKQKNQESAIEQQTEQIELLQQTQKQKIQEQEESFQNQITLLNQELELLRKKLIEAEENVFATPTSDDSSKEVQRKNYNTLRESKHQLEIEKLQKIQQEKFAQMELEKKKKKKKKEENCKK